MTTTAPAKRPRGRQYALTPAETIKAREYRDRGLTYREIGRLMDVPYVTAWRACTEGDYAVIPLRETA